MSARLDISVVVCTYTESRWDFLDAAVKSIQNQNVKPLEIIIVVDHNPKLMERVHESFPDVAVVENQQERGLSGARNSGIAASKAAVIAFIDDDGIAAPDWLKNLYAPYKDPNVVGVGGSIDALWLDGRPRWFPVEFDWVVGCSYRGMPEAAAPVRNLIGCNMSYRREVFDAVGDFQSALGAVGDGLHICCEETELSIRLSQHWPQRVSFYEPRAKVQHQVPKSRGQWKYFTSRCYAEGLAKALVSQFVGSADGLASERTYTIRTLPLGVARGLGDTVFHGDLAGFTRSIVIAAGLTITTIGYLVGIISAFVAHRKANGRKVEPVSRTTI